MPTPLEDLLGIRDAVRALREIEARGLLAPFPAQNWLTGAFRAAACSPASPRLCTGTPAERNEA